MRHVDAERGFKFCCHRRKEREFDVKWIENAGCLKEFERFVFLGERVLIVFDKKSNEFGYVRYHGCSDEQLPPEVVL